MNHHFLTIKHIHWLSPVNKNVFDRRARHWLHKWDFELLVKGLPPDYLIILTFSLSFSPIFCFHAAITYPSQHVQPFIHSIDYSPINFNFCLFWLIPNVSEAEWGKMLFFNQFALANQFLKKIYVSKPQTSTKYIIIYFLLENES